MAEEQIPRMFEQDLRTLSHVERWGTVRKINRQGVADHMYYVAVYSLQIADAIQWSGSRGDLAEWALAHDSPESFSGDVQGPTKRAAVDPARMLAFEQSEAERRYGKSFLGSYITTPSLVDPEVRKIVKAADIMDEVMFLAIEMSMGNMSVESVLNKNVLGRAQAAWMALPAEQVLLERIWRTEIVPNVRATCECDTRHMLVKG